ncbi:MAG: hypothetical protein Q8O64_04870 [Sideroxyarcus sp.]|nr:hypothetical protein [Sideroxyarcus sp.]
MPFTFSATLTPVCKGFTYIDQPALGRIASGNTCTTIGGPGPATSATNNPTARANFGVYPDNNTFIYQRGSY